MDFFGAPQAKEAGRLREINEQLEFSVKMAEQRAQSTVGKAEEVWAVCSPPDLPLLFAPAVRPAGPGF